MDIKAPPMEGPFEFYNGEVKLMFDREEWQYYRLDPNGELVPVDGVTTPIHIIDKSAALVPWAAKMVSEKAVRLFPELESKYSGNFSDLMKEAKTAPRDKLEDAGNVGKQAHEIIEALINHAIAFNGGVVVQGWEVDPQAGVDPRAVNCVNAALDWMKKHDVVWLSTELKVYSKRFNYGGTMDGLCIVDGIKAIADWKTSNYLYPEYAYQTAAYRHAYWEETHDLVDDRWILRLGKEDGKFDPWHLAGVDLVKRDFYIFRLCQQLHTLHGIVKDSMKKKGII